MNPERVAEIVSRFQVVLDSLNGFDVSEIELALDFLAKEMHEFHAATSPLRQGETPEGRLEAEMR